MLHDISSHRKTTLSSTDRIYLPIELEDYLFSVVDRFETGNLTYIESNDKVLFSKLHYLLIRAVMEQWEVTVIDVSNIFDSQLISTIAFSNDIDSPDVLSSIQLCGNLQLSPEDNSSQILFNSLKSKKRQLIWLSGIPSGISDWFGKEENSIKTWEKLNKLISTLQYISNNQNIVLISNIITEKEYCKNFGDLISFENTHIRIRVGDGRRKVDLLYHPYGIQGISRSNKDQFESSTHNSVIKNK